MTPELENPQFLLLLPLALAPLIGSVLNKTVTASISAAPDDALSQCVQNGLRALGGTALVFALFGAAAPSLPGVDVEREGEGAQIVMLIDRSGSMNETFAGRAPSGAEESKAAASKRLLQQFALSRRHDLSGVALFSTSPMMAAPLSEHFAATQGAIDAIDRPGLDYTNIARGLAMALAMFSAGEMDRSRAVLLVSDGAGVIDPRMQDRLRAEFRKANVSLYWLFLRTEGSPGIDDKPDDPDMDTPQAAPERHLDLFFKSLAGPYRVFQAEGAQATEEALRQIDRLERRPTHYVERAPKTELSAGCLWIALCATALLAAAKLLEIAPAPGERS
jgi:mxaC protein